MHQILTQVSYLDLCLDDAEEKMHVQKTQIDTIWVTLDMHNDLIVAQ